MRSAQLAAPGEIQMIDAPLPAPGDHEVLIRIEACGVCGSNLGPWAGAPWFQYPFPAGAPGHEAVGIVEEVGARVHTVRTGNRVAILSHRAYAEFDVADETSILVLPDSLSETTFLGEPLACAMNVFKRALVKPGDRIAVVGAGFLGMLLVQLCKSAGAAVVALDRRECARSMAETFGASAVPFDDMAVGSAIEANQGDLFDVVIEAAGKPRPLSVAAELTRERGRLVIAGYHQDGPREVNMQLWNWRGLDVINAHERAPEVYLSGMREALDTVMDGRVSVEPLITHRVPLEELATALDLTRDRPAGFMKAVVLP